MRLSVRKRSLVSALILFSLVSFSSTSLASANKVALLPAPDEYDGGGGGGGSGGGGGGGTAPNYRLRTVLQTDTPFFPFSGNVEIEAFAFFEKQDFNGNWKPFDAQRLRIDCFVDGTHRDEEDDDNASKADLEFSIFADSLSRRVVACNYSANNGAYTDTRVIFVPA